MYNWLFFTVLILFILLPIGLGSYFFAPWVPSRKKDLPRILKLANLKATDTFYDLGSGTGSVVMYISKHSTARVIGVEIGLPFYFISKLRRLISQRKNLTLRYNNFFWEDLAPANAVFLFGASSKHIRPKLIDKLKTELKPGAKVISYIFPIPGWQATLVDRPSKKDFSIYIYTI